MTYFELLSKANRLLDKGEITIGQRDEMTKPLWDEIRPKGEWVVKVERRGFYAGDKTVYSYTCSCCGRKEFDAYKFCRCGAEMKGGAE